MRMLRIVALRQYLARCLIGDLGAALPDNSTNSLPQPSAQARPVLPRPGQQTGRSRDAPIPTPHAPSSALQFPATSRWNILPVKKCRDTILAQFDRGARLSVKALDSSCREVTAVRAWALAAAHDSFLLNSRHGLQPSYSPAPALVSFV